MFCLLRTAAFGLPDEAVGAAIKDPEQDYAFLEFEPSSRFRRELPAHAGWPGVWRTAGQIAFPAGKVAGHQLFGVFKTTVINKEIIFADTALSDGVLQRYWLSGGVVLLDRPRQSSSFMAGLGLNSDMADLGPMDFNSEWLYTHSFVLSPSFKVGLGADIQQYFHGAEFYPLFFVDWRINDWTKLKWDADYLEVRRFLNPAFSLTLGVRFNLEFFALKQDASWEYQSMGLETGVQYAIGSNWYMRIKYKELVWGNEYYGMPNGSVFRERIAGGRTLRMNFAYGM